MKLKRSPPVLYLLTLVLAALDSGLSPRFWVTNPLHPALAVEICRLRSVARVRTSSLREFSMVKSMSSNRRSSLSPRTSDISALTQRSSLISTLPMAVTPRTPPQPGQSFDERPKSKHDSQWSFQDFVTPQKVKPSRTMRTQDVRHWDTDKDVVDETPGHPAAKPRRDADAHFELLDDGQNERALGNITNVKDRGKDFDHHFDISDESPAHPQDRVPEGHQKAVQMMQHNWDTYDRSPAAQKENRPIENTDSHKINIAGDGMGGRKGTNRDWLYGETQDVPQSIPTRKQPNVVASGVPLTKSAKIHIAGDGMGGKKGTERDWLYNETSETAGDSKTTKPIPTRTPGSNAAPASEIKENTDKHKINIAGDGMGGKKGTERDWLYNETSETSGGQATATKSIPTRTPGSSTAPTNEVRENTDKHKINIAGDGMGGRKGTNRDWLYGELDEQPLPTRQNASSKKDFWDF
ncbi:hypothetical protein FOXG_00433 [Fusarium oxysporum f. sp. lycopersici 4287]|uniref:Uncharacterized protein n=1 Tax=Fusarium oxysporum f. sp. lycopersici (strain 4287 / CBS 123668 / FGSC 9935 / NRRL 34936) TaxID=426428 RepID=A0A0J9U690_FUSO4|nr:hypothetical protein FOXG_00433 [Fusarium oxysporum f. sp. lycopersici 4287]KNA94337.1 hypothetical protein FOXG_00433 [Fusarium oxysporum f. sp. lycopersici 4287]